MSTDLNAGHPEGWPAPRAPFELALDLAALLVNVARTVQLPEEIDARVRAAALTVRVQLADKDDGPAPDLYDRDDLDEANLGVLYAYREVRAKLVDAFGKDWYARRIAAGAVDGLAADLIENNTEPDEDEEPDNDL